MIVLSLFLHLLTNSASAADAKNSLLIPHNTNPMTLTKDSESVFRATAQASSEVVAPKAKPLWVPDVKPVPSRRIYSNSSSTSQAPKEVVKPVGPPATPDSAQKVETTKPLWMPDNKDAKSVETAPPIKDIAGAMNNPAPEAKAASSAIDGKAPLWAPDNKNAPDTSPKTDSKTPIVGQKSASPEVDNGKGRIYVDKHGDKIIVLDFSTRSKVSTEVARNFTNIYDQTAETKDIQARIIRESEMKKMKKTDTYEVEEGDTLESISQKLYGNKSMAEELRLLNEDILTSIRVTPGMNLKYYKVK